MSQVNTVGTPKNGVLNIIPGKHGIYYTRGIPHTDPTIILVVGTPPDTGNTVELSESMIHDPHIEQIVPKKIKRHPKKTVVLSRVSHT